MAENFSKRFRRHLKKRKQPKLTSSMIVEKDARHESNPQRSNATSYQDYTTLSLDNDEEMLRKQLNKTNSIIDDLSFPIRKSDNLELVDQATSPASDHSSRTTTVELLQQRVEECERLMNQKDVIIQQQSDELQATRAALQTTRQQSQKHKQRVFDVNQKFLRWHALIKLWMERNKENRSKNEWSEPPGFESLHSIVLKKNTVTPAKDSLLNNSIRSGQEFDSGLNGKHQRSQSYQSAEPSSVSSSILTISDPHLIKTEHKKNITRSPLENHQSTMGKLAISAYQESVIKNNLLDSSTGVDKQEFVIETKSAWRNTKNGQKRDCTVATTKEDYQIPAARIGKKHSTLKETENHKKTATEPRVLSSCMDRPDSNKENDRQNKIDRRRERQLLRSSNPTSTHQNHDLGQQENKHPNYGKRLHVKRQRISLTEQSTMNVMSQATTQGSQTQLSDHRASKLKSVILPSIPSIKQSYQFPKSVDAFQDKVHHGHNDSQALIDSKTNVTEKLTEPSIKKQIKKSDQLLIQPTVTPAQHTVDQSEGKLKVENKKSVVKAINGWRSNVTTRTFMDEALKYQAPKENDLPNTDSTCEFPVSHDNTKAKQTNGLLSAQPGAPVVNAESTEGKTPSRWLQKKARKESSTTQQEADGSQPYKFVEVVRGKKKRQCLPGHSCSECDPFWTAVCEGNDVFERKQFENYSRHRATNSPQQTPPHFWELSFRDEIHERSLFQANVNSQGEL